MHLVDLEFSEVLEQDNSVSGGFRFSKDTTLNPDLYADFEFDGDIDVYADFDPDLQNVNLNGSVGPVFFPDDVLIVDLVFSPVVGDQIVETPDSIVVDNPSVSQPLCL